VSTYTRLLHQAKFTEKVLVVELMVASDFAVSATNYWTVTVRRRKAGQSFGELVAMFTTTSRKLTGGTPVTLYDDTHGLSMDRLALQLVEPERLL
jgi:hypothetical protein